MTDVMTLGGDYLSHFGVLGMKWGHRKLRPNPTAQLARAQVQYKPIKNVQKRSFLRIAGNTPEEVAKNKKGLIKDAAVIGFAVAAAIGIKMGSNYILEHPQVIQQTVNKIKGTKALTVGYETIQMNLKNGRYVRA